MNQTSALSNNDSFQAAPQQDDYEGNLLIQFFDDVMVVQELNEIYIDMGEE